MSSTYKVELLILKSDCCLLPWSYLLFQIQPSEESDYRTISNAFLQDSNAKQERRNDTPDSAKVG